MKKVIRVVNKNTNIQISPQLQFVILCICRNVHLIKGHDDIMWFHAIQELHSRECYQAIPSEAIFENE